MRRVRDHGDVRPASLQLPDNLIRGLMAENMPEWATDQELPRQLRAEPEREVAEAVLADDLLLDGDLGRGGEETARIPVTRIASPHNTGNRRRWSEAHAQGHRHTQAH